LTLKLKNRFKKEVELKTGSSLRQELNEKFGGNAGTKAQSTAYKRYLAAEGVTVKDVVRALGIEDIGKVNVRELLDNDGTKPLFNAIVEDGLRIGFERESRWNELVAGQVDSDQLSQQYYYLDSDEEEVELRDIGQGAPIPVGTIKLGDQSVKMHKRGRGIEWTDEAKRANIDMVRLWLKQLGKKLGRDYESVAVNRLLNGYFSDGFDAAPTLGVATAGTLTLGDMFYASEFMEDTYGFTPNRAIMNLETATQWAELRDNGAYLFPDSLKNGDFPNVINSRPFISSEVPANRIILVDTGFALTRYTGKEFGVESDRNVRTQVEGSYGTEISEFVPFEKNARMIITLDAAR
jgi:hypothetical protein